MSSELFPWLYCHRFFVAMIFLISFLLFDFFIIGEFGASQTPLALLLVAFVLSAISCCSGINALLRVNRKANGSRLEILDYGSFIAGLCISGLFLFALPVGLGHWLLSAAAIVMSIPGVIRLTLGLARRL